MHPNPEIIRGNEFLATQRKTIPTMEGNSRQRCMNEAFATVSPVERKKKTNEKKGRRRNLYARMKVTVPTYNINCRHVLCAQNTVL